MNFILKILMWIGIVILGISLVAFLSGIILSVIKIILRTIQESRREAKGKRFDKFLQRVGETPGRVVKQLSSSQAFLIGVWYLINLAIVVIVAYGFLLDPPIEVLKVIKDSPTFLYLVQCFGLGNIGAILYGILRISKFEQSEDARWLLRRFILLPILGGFLGAMSYFFVETGLIVVQGASQTAGNANSNFGIYAIAFLSGFASRELTAKLISISRAVFSRVKEEDI